MKAFPVEYRDLKFRIIACLLGAHIFTVYGEPESSLEWLLRKDYYPAFALSLAIAFSVTAYIRWITQKLDRKYLWEKKVSDRIMLQVFLGIVSPALFAFFFTGLYLHLNDVNILKTSYVTHDFQFLCLILLLINAYYLAYYFYQRWQHAEKAVKELAGAPALTRGAQFKVSQGSKNIIVEFDQIAYFYREDEANYLLTIGGQRYYVPSTLDSIIQQLDKRFFRVNRQIIVHRNTIISFKNIEYGKIELTLIPEPAEPAVVSQKTAGAFREWVSKFQ